MATITAFIRTKISKGDPIVNIRFRLSDGRDIQLFYKSDILIPASVWDSRRERVKAKASFPDEERLRINNTVMEYKKMILSIYAASEEAIKDSKYLATLINKRLRPDTHTPENQVLGIFDYYLSNTNLSTNYRKSVMLVKDCVRRFGEYEYIRSGNTYKSLQDFTEETLKKFMLFLTIEHTLFCDGVPLPEYSAIYFPKTKAPKERGRNSVSKMMKIFRTIWNNAIRCGLTSGNPFSQLGMPSQTYGTPYYITIEERNLIADFDLSDNPSLAVQRDIFVFQCLIGCRVSDLYSLTPSNVIGETIQYIARKTAREKPKTIIVPLNNRAKRILQRYYDGIRTDGKLLPFITEQKYNSRIKQVFRRCGITRKVTVYNSKTCREEIRSICDIASSHIARRTFVGNLYKKVGNIDLVASLSGHSPNSSAFFRYRDIDLETKQELVEKIE